MLYFVGVGLNKGDITLKGVEAITESEEVYYDSYTSFISDEYLEELKRLCKKEIIPLKRSDLENPKKLVDEAQTKKVSLLVGGESLIATTHHSIIDDLNKKGIKYEIIHAPSAICAAISESFLHIYKFGRIVTIPYWSEIYQPTSFYEYAYQTYNLGLHTLFLLDIKEENGRIHFMRVNEALQILKNAEAKMKKNLIKPSTKLVVISAIGKENIKVFGSIEEIEKKNIESYPSIIILPGKLHFMEEQLLQQMKL